MELLSWFSRGSYLPHGYCFTWTPGLLWWMVGADALIAAAYYSIPIALITFVRKRGATAFNGVVLLFSAFIFACGTTHLLSIWTIWYPDYGVETLGKVITALLSVGTALMLWPLIPRALQIPSVNELQSAISRLEAEVERRRAAELTRDDTQASLAVTLASIGAGIIRTDAGGNVVDMNPLSEHITGWRIEEARGQPLWNVWVREHEAADQRARNPVDVFVRVGAEGSSNVVHSAVVLSRSGRRTPVEVKAAPLSAADGSVSGMALVFRDMTQIEMAQAESDRLAAIVASSNDAIVSQTLDGRVTSWNRAAEALFGYSAAEIVGQPASLLIPADHEAREEELLKQLAAGARVPPFETLRTRKDGSQVEVSVTVSPVLSGDGRVVGASTISRDISHQKHLEALRIGSVRMEAENRQIQAASRMKSQFLANMSHELRTPLNAIIGFADLLFAGMVPPESNKHQDFLGHIRASGRHLLGLINAVLDLSKVEAGKFEFFPEAVDLPALAQEVVAMLKPEADRKDLKLRAQVDASLIDLHLDPGRLKQVLYNFLSNAIKFTPGGGRIVLRGLPAGDDAFRIEVEDTGIGIKPSDIGKLFVEFQQLDAGFGRRHAGTGLGLALTRRLVEAQGGTVDVRSEPGHGSVFSAVLPRRVPATAAEAAPAPALPMRAWRLLMLEDESAQLSRLAATLPAQDGDFDAARNRSQAREKSAAAAYSGIVLDLKLVDHEGLDVLTAAKSSAHNRATPVRALMLAGSSGALAGLPLKDMLPALPDASALSAALPAEGRGITALVIDDDAHALARTVSALQAVGALPRSQLDPTAALSDIETLHPDAILFGWGIVKPGALPLLLRLAALQASGDTAVFLCGAPQGVATDSGAAAQLADALLGAGRSAAEALRAPRVRSSAQGQPVAESVAR